MTCDTGAAHQLALAVVAGVGSLGIVLVRCQRKQVVCALIAPAAAAADTCRCLGHPRAQLQVLRARPDALSAHKICSCARTDCATRAIPAPASGGWHTQPSFWHNGMRRRARERDKSTRARQAQGAPSMCWSCCASAEAHLDGEADAVGQLLKARQEHRALAAAVHALMHHLEALRTRARHQLSALRSHTAAERCRPLLAWLSALGSCGAMGHHGPPVLCSQDRPWALAALCQHTQARAYASRSLLSTRPLGKVFHAESCTLLTAQARPRTDGLNCAWCVS